MLVGIGVIICISFLCLGYYKFFGPKYENVRREVFESTRSYNEAKVQDLLRYKYEYDMCKDEEGKKAIEFTVRHMFANYDENKLPIELCKFLKDIKYSRR
jgi:hypothetical protein